MDVFIRDQPWVTVTDTYRPPFGPQFHLENQSSKLSFFYIFNDTNLFLNETLCENPIYKKDESKATLVKQKWLMG